MNKIAEQRLMTLMVGIGKHAAKVSDTVRSTLKYTEVPATEEQVDTIKLDRRYTTGMTKVLPQVLAKDRRNKETY